MFIKVKHRQNNIDLIKINSIKLLFAFKFAKAIEETTQSININQSSINQHMKVNRSWGFKY